MGANDRFFRASLGKPKAALGARVQLPAKNGFREQTA
jgi:hypothetical protein